MESLCALVCLFAIIASFSTLAAPANNSQNPQIDTIRRGLIQKLCDNAHGKVNPVAIDVPTSPKPGNLDDSSSPTQTPRPVRRTIPAGALEPPTCTEFNSMSLEQLIEKNKALLRPVKTTGRAFP